MSLARCRIGWTAAGCIEMGLVGCCNFAIDRHIAAVPAEHRIGMAVVECHVVIDLAGHCTEEQTVGLGRMIGHCIETLSLRVVIVELDDELMNFLMLSVGVSVFLEATSDCRDLRNP